MDNFSYLREKKLPMRYKIFTTIALIALAVLNYLQYQSNNSLKADITRWRDNYNVITDINNQMYEKVKDAQEIVIKQDEIWRTENKSLKGEAKRLRKENSRLEGLILANITIVDTVYSTTSTLDTVCEGEIAFKEEYFEATAKIGKSNSLAYKATAPLHIIRYVKYVPRNPRKFQLWAIEHRITRWIIRKKEQDRVKIWSDNPHLTTSVESYKIIQE